MRPYFLDKIYRSNLGTTQTKGFKLIDDTPATLAIPVQYSPIFEQEGTAFNSLTSLSEIHKWRWTVTPVSVAGTTTSSYLLERSINGVAYATAMKVDSTGKGWFTGLDAGSAKITNVATGTAAGDALIYGQDITLANSVTALTSGNYAIQMKSGILTTGGVDYGYIFDIVTPGIGASGDIHTDWRNNNVSVMSLGLNTLNAVYGGTLTVTRSAIGATSTTYDQTRCGLVLNNGLASVAGPGVTTQVSPAAEFLSHAWASGAGADDTWSWRILNIPTTGAMTQGILTFQVANKVGGAAWGTYTTQAQLIPRAAFPATADFSVTNALYVGEGGAFRNGNHAFGNVNSVTGDVTAGYNSNATNTHMIVGSVADSATAVGVILRNSTALTVPGSQIVRFITGTAQKSYIDLAGAYVVPKTALGASLAAPAAIVVSADITAESNVGGLLGIDCGAAHGLTTGMMVTISNANDAAHNKNTLVTTTGLNTFTCDNIAYVAGAGASNAKVERVANPTANDGLFLYNRSSGTGVQEFSPSLRFDAMGYTAAATYVRQSWAINNQPVDAMHGMLAFSFTSAGGAYGAAKATLSEIGTFAAVLLKTTTVATAVGAGAATLLSDTAGAKQNLGYIPMVLSTGVTVLVPYFAVG